MPEAIIFIGAQATGKTSFFKDAYIHTHVRISMDVLKTRNREWRFLELCIDTQMSLVIDNTNPTRDDRARYIGPLRDAGFTVVGYYFESSLQKCIHRNGMRSGKQKIPEIGIRGTHARLELPEMNEGFDKLWFASINSESQFEVEGWRSEF